MPQACFFLWREALCTNLPMVCHNYGKRGHLAKVCLDGWSWMELKRPPHNSLPGGREEPKDTHCMVEPVSEDEATYMLFNTRESRVNPMMVSLKLNQKRQRWNSTSVLQQHSSVKPHFEVYGLWKRLRSCNHPRSVYAHIWGRGVEHTGIHYGHR